MSNVPQSKRDQHLAGSGIELKSDDTQFDVPEWREGVTSRAEAQSQTRNGQDHQRVYDAQNNLLLKEILAELKLMNLHLASITDEEFENDN